MADQIKTISDKDKFEEIFRKFFKNDNTYLKTKSGDLKIIFLDYSDTIVTFKIPYLNNVPAACLVFAREGNYTIHAILKSYKKLEKNLFQFTVEKFQIIFRARGEIRKSLDGIAPGESKNIIFISNLISYPIIQNSLAIEIKKTERIKEYLYKEMSQAYNYVKIYFCNEGKHDTRMQYFFSNKKPIYIPKIDINNPNAPETKNNFYFSNIYLKDQFLQSRKEYISEISIPLLYRLKLPYGYIQLNNSSIFSSSTLMIAKKFALLVDELLNKENVFPKSEDKLIVSNMSKGGLGIVFKERKHIRYFKENSYVFFDLLLPDNKSASILAKVRNITLMDNKIIMVGCSIEEIDALSDVYYDEFLQTLPAAPAQEQKTESIPDQKEETESEEKPESVSEQIIN